jgi:hypothetical protein
MAVNRAKEKLAAGGTVLVLNPNFPSPALTAAPISSGWKRLRARHARAV